MRALQTPSANDGPGFHMNIPVSELIEHDTRAVKASVVSSAPPIAEAEDGVTQETWPTPIRPQGARGLELLNPRSRDQGSKAGLQRVQGRLVSKRAGKSVYSVDILYARPFLALRPRGKVCVNKL